MYYKGVVTNVDTTFLFFVLDDCVKVHMSILMTQKKSQALPVIGSEVVIKHAHRDRCIIIVRESSTLIGDFSVPRSEDRFLKLVQDHKLGARDLLRTEQVINLIENNFKDLEQNLKINLIYYLMQNIISLSECNINHPDNTWLNQRISNFNMITTNFCKSIEVQSSKFNDFPHWSFGIHSNPSNALLFGYLEMHPMYGFLLLKDKCYQIPCIIYNAPSEMSSLSSSYVALKKYKVITEIYRENNVPNIEYFLIDFNDINIVYTVRSTEHVCLFGDKKHEGRSFKSNICFQLKRKSTIRVDASNAVECWFQISIINQDGRELSEEAFLILPAAYVKVIINFKEGMTYGLFYNMALNVVNNPELTRVKKLKIYKIQENDAYFLKCDEAANAQNILTVAQCKNHILNNTDLVSFEGTLKSKRFTDALPSHASRKSKIYGFGTPGSKVHQLVFCIEGDGVKYLDCYLNSWDNVLMPLGLIPEMRVIVRNVYPQSKKYVKSSAFTTFEIVSYNPLVYYNTVNLYENDDLDWGQRSFLGRGNKLPHGVLIWGKVMNLLILSLKIMNQCAGCKSVKENLGECVQCHQTEEKELSFLLKMHVSDEFGQSKVLAKFPDIMKSILDLQEHQFQIWLKAIEEIGSYEYNFFEDVNATGSTKDEVACFKRCLTDFVTLVNEQAMITLDLKCRKLDSNPLRNGGRPLWLCIDARKTVNF